MQIHKAVFNTSAPDLESCPDSELREFAFIGRSNVGKSSLINMLTNQRKPLADVSKTPGRTQLINFFTINDKWSLVDLPGYGYAKVSGQKRNRFNEFVSDYLLNREKLTCVFILVDSRLSPQTLDLEFTRWLMESEIPFVLLFTKADKMKPGAVQRNIDAFHDAMSEWCDGLPRTYVTSATKAQGKKDILNFIGQALEATF
ncbi:ribosome biogenesis GTP-binding protein YihA/YsxC [Rubritalea marina]|uniref:ribosome biogenesis GTP-binding protein YihA/YsxC n=1 Tax=Rubritalea marina TaxID=361055 RepID=UPI00036985C8|nr:ribosome biogenesis GTP-binding protein YihA/YsxC [Rubritalea marina]